MPTISEFRDALDIARRFVTCKTDNIHPNAIAELEELLLKTNVRYTGRPILQMSVKTTLFFTGLIKLIENGNMISYLGNT